MNTWIGNERYHRYMSSDTPPGAFPPDHGQHWGPPSPTASTPSAPPLTAFRRSPRWPAFIALAIALVALTVSLVGWFRPAPHNTQPPPKPTYTDQQVADAKAKVCAVFGQLDRAVVVGNGEPRGSDALVAAINTRQIFDVFSRNLLATLAEEPATPADLAAAVRTQADTLEQIVIEYQDGFGTSDPQVRPLVDANSASADKIRQLCK
jgi:hypothetical protein